MENNFLGAVVVVLMVITSMAMFVGGDWRWVLAALGFQYLWAFILISSSWPLELAAVKLVTGWMAGAILGLTRLTAPVEEEDSSARLPASNMFQVFAALLVILVVLGSAPRLAEWAGDIGIHQAWGGLVLVGMGLLQISLSPSVFKGFLGLLMLFSGFEIFYAAVETSTLVAGLLAALNLGIALVGSYLILSPGMEPRQ